MMAIGSYRICKRIGHDTYSVYAIETGEKLAGHFDSLDSAAEWISDNLIPATSFLLS